MGEIIRSVRLEAVYGATGEPKGGSIVVDGIIDTGSRSVVISTDLADALDADVVPDGTFVEGRPRAVAVLRAGLLIARCPTIITTVVVDNALASRAGVAFEGSEWPPIIIGHDLLQQSRAAFRYGAVDRMSCARARSNPLPTRQRHEQADNAQEQELWAQSKDAARRGR